MALPTKVDLHTVDLIGGIVKMAEIIEIAKSSW